MAKLTEAAAVKLLGKHLSRTARFPDEAEALKDLARTLMQAAPDAELAGKVVDELRRACEFCPSDAEIFRVADMLRGASQLPKWQPRSERCPVGQCDGSGWVTVTVAGTEGSRPCACRAKSSGGAA